MRLVPGDVAVLGVGDDMVICENQAVPISSVKHHIHRIGYTGAALLDRLMNPCEGLSPRISLSRSEQKTRRHLIKMTQD